MKHTPGPWIIDAVKFVTTPKSVVIAELNDSLNGEFPDSGYWEQNAHLIAAAPAMYEALRSIPDHALNCGHKYPHTTACWNCIVKDALAQAKGGAK